MPETARKFDYRDRDREESRLESRKLCNGSQNLVSFFFGVNQTENDAINGCFVKTRDIRGYSQRTHS